MTDARGGRPFVGRPMPRLEDERLLRGNGRYSDDWTLPNQTWAVFVRSPHAHARVVAIRTHTATAWPGVRSVLTGAEYVADGCLGIAQMPVPADTLDYQRPAFGVFDGRRPLDEPHLPLAVERVRYPGEAVAVVIADTLPAALGAYDAEAGTYLMIAGSQGVVRQRATLAAALGVEVERVRVICPEWGAASVRARRCIPSRWWSPGLRGASGGRCAGPASEPKPF